MKEKRYIQNNPYDIQTFLEALEISSRENRELLFLDSFFNKLLSSNNITDIDIVGLSVSSLNESCENEKVMINFKE